MIIFGMMPIMIILLLEFLGNKLKLLLIGELCIKISYQNQEKRMVKE